MKALTFPAVVAGMMTFSTAWAAPAALNDAQLENVSAGGLTISVSVPINLNTNVQQAFSLGLAGALFGGSASASATSFNINVTNQFITTH